MDDDSCWIFAACIFFFLVYFTLVGIVSIENGICFAVMLVGGWVYAISLVQRCFISWYFPSEVAYLLFSPSEVP